MNHFAPKQTAPEAARHVCADTTTGFLWLCDAHDTHGNAGSVEEARELGEAHSDFMLGTSVVLEACAIVVYARRGADTTVVSS